jgi:hypothetical protein
MASARARGRSGGAGVARPVAVPLSLSFLMLMAGNYALQSLRDAQLQFVGAGLGSRLVGLSTLASLLLAPCARLVVKEDAQGTARAIGHLHHALALVMLASGAVPLGARADAWSVTPDDPVLLTCCLFVLSQALNNLVISVTWSHASDLLIAAEYAKFFSVFGAASTVGQGAGSLAASALLAAGLNARWLGLVVLLATEVSAQCLVLATRRAGGFANGQQGEQPSRPSQQQPSQQQLSQQHGGLLRRLGQGALRFAAPFSDSYVLWICLYTVMYTGTMSLIYLERATAVAALGMGPDHAAAVSAKLSLVASVATLAVQVLLSYDGPARWLSADVGLLSLPAVTAAGFALASNPALAGGAQGHLRAVLAFELARRVVAFAVAKPSREALYAVMPREHKFHTKGVVDTVVYRLGMALGAAAFDLTHGNASLLAALHLAVALTWFAASLAIRARWVSKGGGPAQADSSTPLKTT